MPKRIELFEQSAGKDIESLRNEVNDWLARNPDADNVEIQIGGHEGKTTIMVYYKTVA